MRRGARVCRAVRDCRGGDFPTRTRILHRIQKQPLRRRRWTRPDPTPRLQPPQQLFLTHISLPYLDQHSHHISHHMLQKPAPTNAVNPVPVRARLPRRRKNRAHQRRALIMAGIRRKRRKIVLAFKHTAIIVHPRLIERERVMAHEPPLKRRTNFGPPDPVFIRL